MASTGTQPQLEISVSPPVPAISNSHRWTDLSLVLLVAFATSILSSIYRAFYPGALNYSSFQLFMGLVEESIPLALFFVLLKRQGRSLQDLGFSFRWTDVPKALGLTLASFMTIMVAYFAVAFVHVLKTSESLRDTGPRSNFSGASLWLIVPFIILNGFFEETIVRGYLMTELIDLRKSVVLAALVSLGVQTSYHLYYGVFGAAMVGSGLSIFAVYYAKSRRLMPVILAHVFWDFVTVFLKLHHS